MPSAVPPRLRKNRAERIQTSARRRRVNVGYGCRLHKNCESLRFTIHSLSWGATCVLTGYTCKLSDAARVSDSARQSSAYRLRITNCPLVFRCVGARPTSGGILCRIHSMGRPEVGLWDHLGSWDRRRAFDAVLALSPHPERSYLRDLLPLLKLTILNVGIAARRIYIHL